MKLSFKLTNETVISPKGETLYRIKAIQDIPSAGVIKGQRGGFVSSERLPSGEARISGNAWVYDDAWVSGDARVYGNAWVYGDALVSGNAQVYGDARVSGDARVYGNAWVYGDALVYGDAQVSGDAQVYGNAWVSGDARVSGDAWVYGNAWVSGDARVYGNAWVSGNAQIKSLSGILVIQIVQAYHVTVTVNHVQVGCTLLTKKEALSISKNKAIRMGLPSEYYSTYKKLIKLAYNIVK